MKSLFKFKLSKLKKISYFNNRLFLDIIIYILLMKTLGCTSVLKSQFQTLFGTARGRKQIFFNKRWFTEQFVSLPLNKLNYNKIFLKDKKIYLR